MRERSFVRVRTGSGSVDGDAVDLHEIVGGHHPDGVPGQVAAGLFAQCTADALVEPDLDRRHGDVVLIPRDQLDAVDGAEGDADLAAGATVLVDDGHLLGADLLLADLLNDVADFVVVSFYAYSHLSRI